MSHLVRSKTQNRSKGKSVKNPEFHVRLPELSFGKDAGHCSIQLKYFG